MEVWGNYDTASLSNFRYAKFPMKILRMYPCLLSQQGGWQYGFLVKLYFLYLKKSLTSGL